MRGRKEGDRIWGAPWGRGSQVEVNELPLGEDLRQ